MIRKILMTACLSVAGNIAAAQLEWVASYDTGYKKGAEIISVQQHSSRAALTISGKNQVDILSLASPARPERLLRIDIEGRDTGDISSVAFHPSKDVIAVALIAKDPLATGKVAVYRATTGQQIARFDTGYWPDSVLFSPDGHWLAVANEGEPFVRRGKHDDLFSPPGSVTLINIQQGFGNAVVQQITLPDLTGVAGVLQGSHKRAVERDIDLNGNGIIEADEEELEIPIASAAPQYLEPEYLAYSPDSTELFVALQENNAVLVVDVAAGVIKRSFGLGITSHLADTRDDGKVDFSETLTAFREPDGIALSANGRWLLTADEGDTEPKASKLQPGQIGGGGRTLSLFDSATGALLGDTGNQLDAMAHKAGLYPDKRSDNKGAEPETVVYLEMNSIPYAVVTLERADALALVNIANPRQPVVESVASLRTAGDSSKSYAPEGLALYRGKQGEYFLICANEKRGTLSVMQLR